MTMQLSKNNLGQIALQPGLNIPDSKLLELPEKVLQFGEERFSTTNAKTKAADEAPHSKNVAARYEPSFSHTRVVTSA